MIKTVKIVKSVYAPDNIQDVWIDLSTKPATIKIFKNGGWEGVSDAATASDIEEMQEALAKAQMMIQSMDTKITNKANKNEVIAKGSLGKVNGKSLEEEDVTIDLSPYITEEAANNAFVSKENFIPTEENFTPAEKEKLAGIAEGATNVTVDSEITEGGANPVEGGAVYEAIQVINAEVATKTAQTAFNAHANNAAIHVPSGGTQGQMLIANGDGTSSWASADLIDLLAYGIEWDTTVANPNCTRIGNPMLHKSLPIQSALRGCVAHEGVVNYYLDADDWAYMEDGVTPSILDGSEGTVEVDTGMTFYGKSFEVGNKRRVYISTVQIDSTWVEIPRMLIGAYKATVDTTDAGTPRAVSVMNTTANFRGGNNRTANDTYLATDPFRSDLGKPRTNLSRAVMRGYANNAKAALLSYEHYKWVLYWLPVIEYATFNMQQAFNAELTSEGYHQGGLGPGVTNWIWDPWAKYNGDYPLTPCGYANSLGNHTGVVQFTIPATTASDGTNIASITFSIARWRGIENIFGDNWTNLDCVILRNDVNSDDGAGNYTYKNVYALKNPASIWDLTAEDLTALALDTITDEFEIVGRELNFEGYTKEFDLGSEAEIIPNASGGNVTSHKCDYHWIGSKTDQSLRALRVGGLASAGAMAGLGSFTSYDGVGNVSANVGFRTSCKYRGKQN